MKRITQVVIMHLLTGIILTLVACNSSGTKTKSIDLGNGVVLEMVFVKGGKFQMGSPESEPGHQKHENPRHEVTLDGFWMGKYEVTQAQYSAIIQENPSRREHEIPERPVDSVTWDDAMEYCETLSTRTGLSFSLPTEAQWEYACRAGNESRFCFGDSYTQLCEYAWYEDNANDHTHSVGQKKPNAWGLHDMHGNVYEWCLDDLHESYYGAPTDGSRWGTGTVIYQRMLRGGSYDSKQNEIRCAYRNAGGTRLEDYKVGFRVVKAE